MWSSFSQRQLLVCFIIYSDAFSLHVQTAYYNLGVVYSEMMQYDMALNCYEKVALERPTYLKLIATWVSSIRTVKTWNPLLPVMRVFSPMPCVLYASLSRCLAVSPNFEIAKITWQFVDRFRNKGDINQGVAYKKALYYNWHYADAMYNLGVAYGEMLNFDMAIVFYELAFHFNPHCAEACNNLGVIYKDRDNLDKAVECCQAILLKTILRILPFQLVLVSIFSFELRISQCPKSSRDYCTSLVNW
ncbi:putative UDP-N-acetylglucosamine--peptide N-acetylglucosaminyltransferase SPINDLY [Camellia lanceoleosa]|uniref:UDP-N-acetylglucosamine--peptide N-acetylglucosaminyltransferase SPINDLY n=1 Tax=Camellia lanceoleosa TaxID=1840588 RepID=A0ACC0FV24_9ERIC|nr:putative UDP-N-acetylglucosamine--peptide N-acetylglucosaminyltransferase SPINDLY [Camellia lanceoleosa]